MSKEINVLVSCYACGPNWGSEVGMGWNWVINLSQFCQLHVITEKGFQQEIEEAIPALKLTYPPRFHYVDIGDTARELFWKQGSFKFYSYYREWQQSTRQMAEELLVANRIDIVHQLNMTGYREPGYLWQLPVPFVWGPVAGFGQVPWSYILQMKLKNKLFWGAKHLVNGYQMRYTGRVKKAVSATSLLVAATRETQTYVKELFGKESVIINDSGTFNEIAPVGDKTKGETLRIIWVGIINSRKALEIGIKALAQTKINRDFVLEVCGNGPEEDDCKKLSQELGISGQVKFNGRLPHTEVIKRMREADLMLFTSLMEGTPNVVNEALSLGLPVICHNICGQGELINETCGLKVPLINPEKSAELFAEAIDKLTPESINRMSQNAFERAKQLTWYKKAESMYGYYQKLV